jgi:4-aminobutyrate aminotransferase/4-aminobutyrate aminotransferase/(S)-3-amino-2-methylpropionate transaminase
MPKNWWKAAAEGLPRIITELPGPKSKVMHANTTKYMKGLSSQVKLFPVCFDEGHGIMLKDVDGNKYLDFSSGIYVTSLGHCHPKISEAVSYWAKRLMNAHDFTTPVKEKMMEKMVSVLPGHLNSIQLYSDGTSAVEAAIRAARAITNKHEFISAYRDFHGKSLGAVSCAQMYRGETFSYGPTRAAGFYMVPRPDPYRPLWTKADGTIDTDAYIRFYRNSLKKPQSEMLQLLCSNLYKVGLVVFFLQTTFFQSFGYCATNTKYYFMMMKSLPEWDVQVNG